MYIYIYILQGAETSVNSQFSGLAISLSKCRVRFKQTMSRKDLRDASTFIGPRASGHAIINNIINHIIISSIIIIVIIIIITIIIIIIIMSSSIIVCFIIMSRSETGAAKSHPMLPPAKPDQSGRAKKK